MSLPTTPEETAGAGRSSPPALVGLFRLPGLTDRIFRWRPPTARYEVVAEGVEEGIRLLQDTCRASAVRRKARDIPRGYIARWGSSDRTRLIALDVVDACTAHLVGDLPRNNIIPRVFYSTLKREAKNWWQRHQQQPKQQPSPAAHKGTIVDGATPALPGGGSDAAEELKGLLMEMDQLRAEVRELRREVVQVRTQMGGTKLQVQGEELAGELAAADVDGSSSQSQSPAGLGNLLSKVACDVSGKVLGSPEVADAMEKLRFWDAGRGGEQEGSSATGEDVRTSSSSSEGDAKG